MFVFPHAKCACKGWLSSAGVDCHSRGNGTIQVHCSTDVLGTVDNLPMFFHFLKKNIEVSSLVALAAIIKLYVPKHIQVEFMLI